jgi:very-short-patch-repair endonuclease
MLERILEAAREHRKRPTSGEDLLWACLRDHRMEGRHFRRQHPIGPFIVDFYCAAEKLVIEVDGGAHFGREREDAERQHSIASRSVRFLRFTDDEVRHDLDAVTQRIRQTFARSSPLPTPLPLGGEGPGVGGPAATPKPDFAPLTPPPAPDLRA